jgi:kynurenine formamidase
MVVLIRTEWVRKWLSAEYFGPDLPGIDVSGAEWLVECGASAIGSDTHRLEVRPRDDVHVKLLYEARIPIIENLTLEELAESRSYSFTFVALPLRIAGSTGSPIRPIAII